MRNFDYLNGKIAQCVLGEQYSTDNGWTFVVTGKHYVSPDGTYWHVTLTAPDGEKRDVESKGNIIKGWLKKSSFARANKETGNGANGTPVQNNGTSKRISTPKNGVKLLSYDEMETLASDMVQTYNYVQQCITRYKGTPLCSVIMHQQKKQRITIAWAKRKAKQSTEYKQRLLNAQQRLLELKLQIADAFNDDADMETLNNLKTAINEQTALVNHLTAHIQ